MKMELRIANAFFDFVALHVFVMLACETEADYLLIEVFKNRFPSAKPGMGFGRSEPEVDRWLD